MKIVEVAGDFGAEFEARGGASGNRSQNFPGAVHDDCFVRTL